MTYVDENLFFREATLSLSSSLDIEAALKRCYEYIRLFIPVTLMSLGIHDLEENSFRLVALVGEDLSELFGHEKGAFTGAISQKRGRFERADKGTIFLDEIGELPPQAQVRLLHVLQRKEIERVGGTHSIPIDSRVISATHRNLQEMVGSGLRCR